MSLPIMAGFILSCNTLGKGSPRSYINDTNTYEEYNYKGITFLYKALTEEDLEIRHGLDSRYFNEPAGLFPPRRPCVIPFNIVLPSHSEMTLLYKETLLHDAYGNSYPAQSRKDYYDLWQGKTAESLLPRLNWLIDHNIHKEVLPIPPDSRREGYFVFLMNRPRQGDFLLTVPVVINGKRGRLSLPLSLDLDRNEPDSPPVTDGPAFIPLDN